MSFEYFINDILKNYLFFLPKVHCKDCVSIVFFLHCFHPHMQPIIALALRYSHLAFYEMAYMAHCVSSKDA